MNKPKELGCTNHYCYLTGKRKGAGTNAGCTCLREIPTPLRLAIERRIQGLESDLKVRTDFFEKVTKQMYCGIKFMKEADDI